MQYSLLIYLPGISPVDVSYANNFIPKLHKNWVSPMFSSIVYTTDDIQKAFFLLMLLIIIGEFFAAPAITLADSAVITLLGEDADKYGHQVAIYEHLLILYKHLQIYENICNVYVNINIQKRTVFLGNTVVLAHLRTQMIRNQIPFFYKFIFLPSRECSVHWDGGWQCSSLV